jgi:hypothetical protein
MLVNRVPFEYVKTEQQPDEQLEVDPKKFWLVQ